MQDLWRPCGDRGLLLLASAASVQQRIQQPMRTTAAVGRYRHTYRAAPLIATRTAPIVCIQMVSCVQRARCVPRRQSLRRSVAVIHRQGRTTLDLQIQWSDRHDKASSQADGAGRFPSPARRYNRRSGGLSVRPGQSRVTSYRPGH